MDLITAVTRIDGQIFILINNLPHNYWLDQFFLFFSFYPLVVWLFLGALAILYEEKADIWFGARLILALGMAGFFASVFLKPIIARPRPDIAYKEQVVVVTEKPAVLPWNNDYAFPSGHAAIAFAGAYVLTREENGKKKKHRLLRLTFLVIAILTALSRIYLGKHYPFDVIVGGAIGWLMGFAGWKLVDLVRPPRVWS